MSTAILSREPDTDEIEYRYTDNRGEKMYIQNGNHGAIITVEDESAWSDPGVEVSYADIPQLIAVLTAILKDGNR